MELKKIGRDRESRIGFFTEMYHKQPRSGPPTEPKKQSIAWDNDNKIEYRHKTPSSRWDGGVDLWAAQLDPVASAECPPGNADGKHNAETAGQPTHRAVPSSRWCALHSNDAASQARKPDPVQQVYEYMGDMAEAQDPPENGLGSAGSSGGTTHLSSGSTTVSWSALYEPPYTAAAEVHGESPLTATQWERDALGESPGPPAERAEVFQMQPLTPPTANEDSPSQMDVIDLVSVEEDSPSTIGDEMTQLFGSPEQCDENGSAPSDPIEEWEAGYPACDRSTARAGMTRPNPGALRGIHRCSEHCTIWEGTSECRSQCWLDTLHNQGGDHGCFRCWLKNPIDTHTVPDADALLHHSASSAEDSIGHRLRARIWRGGLAPRTRTQALQ